MAYQVILAPRAIRDLEEIVRYISLDSPANAERFGRRLFEQARSIAAFPKIGRMVPELGEPLIREIIFKAYRIVYRVREDKQVVEISRFWHAARGTPTID